MILCTADGRTADGVAFGTAIVYNDTGGSESRRKLCMRRRAAGCEVRV